MERASRRFATLAQAISSRNPTAASSTTRYGCTLPTISSFIETRVMPASLLATGKAAARLRATTSMSALACATVTPGFSRPMACALTEIRRSRNDGSFHWPMGV